ncbi:hypothetical protein KC866_03130 [Patescibacteria group bacterium]|nr:hypothetical protein [Patescibacteria group bacterium]
MVIIFDIGGVILKADHKITFKTLSNLGVEESRAKMFFKNDDYRDFSRGLITGREFYRALVDRHLQCNLSYNDVVDAHNKHIYAIDKDVLRVVGSLNNKIIFLTDTNEWQNKREKELVDLARYSDAFFRSNEIGMLKIDSTCFPYVISKLKEQPDNILLIDDSIEKIDEARKNKIRTIHFTDVQDLLKSLKNINLL